MAETITQVSAARRTEVRRMAKQAGLHESIRIAARWPTILVSRKRVPFVFFQE